MRVLRAHLDAVRSVAYAANGRELATAGDDGTVRVWDLGSDAPPRCLVGHPGEAPEARSTHGVAAVAYPPDGRSLAFSDGPAVVLYDLETRHQQGLLREHQAEIRSLAFAHGRRLLSLDWSGGIKLWDLDTLSAALEFRSDPGEVTALHPSGTLLAMGHPRGNLALVRETGEPVHSWDGHKRGVTAVAFSPDGKLLASADDSGLVRLWDVADATRCGEWAADSWVVYGLAFTPDGRSLLTGGAKGTVRETDAATGVERAMYRWHGSWVTCLAVAPDGLTAAAGSADHTVVVWDLAD